MKVLIIGSGGREHALAWQCAQFDEVVQVFVAPGNAGSALENKISNIQIDSEDIPGLIEFAQSESIDITIVGPEAPLVIGIVDEFQDKGLPIFGPSKLASQLEGSKVFCKDFLARNNIPTAYYEVFTETLPAIEYVKEKGLPIVIKADGLAAGKGVIIANTLSEATHAINDMLDGNRFGEAGSRVVIEEFLRGEEASFIVMVDGNNILPMATSQDHKARDNGDKGPNTGGMGAYSPTPIVTDILAKKIQKEVIEKTIHAMKNEGIFFKGFLYAGIMIKDDVPYVLEYNVRMGDPECQPITMRMNFDLYDYFVASVDGTLSSIPSLSWKDQFAVCVVLASNGYPGSYPTNDEITGFDSISNDTNVFHAGTKKLDGKILSNGGRVLGVTSLGDSLESAISTAYSAIEKINWSNKYCRTDIGKKGLSYF